MIPKKAKLFKSLVLTCLVTLSLCSAINSDSGTQSVIELLLQAKKRNPHQKPVLSPYDKLVGTKLDAKSVQDAGFPVVVWTVNDPARIAELISQKVDGIISDRPDLLREELSKARGSLSNSGDRSYFERFDAEAHRGGRDLRPENTLPAFESGLDQLVTTLETDTGVTADGISLISHEQFLNAQTCRLATGGEYTRRDQVSIKDITMAEAQQRFICDRVFRGPQQKNDLSLSPVAMAFAKEKRLLSPYVPTYATQLFEFVHFYVNYYRSGPGKSDPQAEARWQNAAKVRFNLETKLTPESSEKGHTFAPESFVRALCGAIEWSGMESRSDVQSFDFRTLELVEKKHPKIQTVYLLESIPGSMVGGSATGRK